MFAPPIATTKTKSAELRRAIVEPQRQVQPAVSRIQQLQSRIGNQALSRLLAHKASIALDNESAAAENVARLRYGVQAKLTIGAVNDPLEEEADRVADHVMRMPAPDASVSTAPPQVSRKCAECEEEEKKLRKKEAGTAAAAAAEAPPIVHEALRSSGQPLEHATRASVEARGGRDFSEVRVHSESDGESMRAAPTLGASGGHAAGLSGILERIAYLKEHRFLCPPVADSLTSISKITRGGGTLGYTKIDKSSELKCHPKFDINAKAGTCTFKPVAPSLSITSRFSAATEESLTADSMAVPSCGQKPVPIYGKITKDLSDLVKQGEQEHCDDLTLSFNRTLKPCATEVNKFAGHPFTGKTEDDCFKALTTKLGFDPISCAEEFLDMTKKDDERDNTGMHDFDPVLISQSCTKIVTGFKKSATNKVGDAGVAPSKFIPASSKCAKAAVTPAPKLPPSPSGSGTPAPAPKKSASGE